MTQVKLNSLLDLDGFVADIVERINPGTVIALSGNLGAGKTTFTQRLLARLGVTERVISPTFVLHRQYSSPVLESTIHHLDLYRLSNIQEAQDLGIVELLSQTSGLVVIEWPQKISSLLPRDTINIDFEVIDNEQRLVNITQENT